MSGASVTCVDGKIRKFVSFIEDECLHYEGRKYVYVLWPEPEGRGFIVMTRVEGDYILAPRWIQPLLVEAEGPSGRWTWEQNQKRR